MLCLLFVCVFRMLEMLCLVLVLLGVCVFVCSMPCLFLCVVVVELLSSACCYMIWGWLLCCFLYVARLLAPLYLLFGVNVFVSVFRFVCCCLFPLFVMFACYGCVCC